jgi:catechol 2,3-dioxygenase-like lactoylglutathione lyase family enzyme
MNLKHISLVSVPVTDQDKAKDFYTGMLGFTVKFGNNWLITQERDGS